MSPDVQGVPSSMRSRTVHIRSECGNDCAGGAVRVADSDGALGEILLEASGGRVDRLSPIGGALAVLGFDGDHDGADADLDVDSSVAGLGGLFLGVKTAFAQLFSKPHVQDGLTSAGSQ